MSQDEIPCRIEPQLVADVRLYETAAGGRKGPILHGWGCPVMISDVPPLHGWDARLLLGDEPLYPGEARRLGFVFLSGLQAADAIRQAGRFYLWEGGFVGEATVVR
jgi:hypothetical protein